MKLAADDRIVAVFPGWDDYELLLVTANGQGIRFAGRRRAAGRPRRGRDPRHPAQGRRPGGRRVRGRRRGDRRDRDRAGVRQAHRGRRVPGAGARRLRAQGREDRQGARQARRGRARGRHARVPRGRRVPGRARPRRARRVARRRGIEGLPGTGLQRVVAVAPRRATTPEPSAALRRGVLDGVPVARREIRAEVVGDVHEVVGRLRVARARRGAGTAAIERTSSHSATASSPVGAGTTTGP